MSPTMRRNLVFAALGATILAVILAPNAPSDDVAQPTAANRGLRSASIPPSPQSMSSGPSRSSGADNEPDTVLEIIPRTAQHRPGVLFAAEGPAPIAASAALPPPEAAPPTAPPLPFRVLGYYQDRHGVRSVFLDDHGESLVARVGDTLHNDTYRVQDITEDAMRLIYLPLSQPQTLLLEEHP